MPIFHYISFESSVSKDSLFCDKTEARRKVESVKANIKPSHAYTPLSPIPLSVLHMHQPLSPSSFCDVLFECAHPETTNTLWAPCHCTLKLTAMCRRATRGRNAHCSHVLAQRCASHLCASDQKQRWAPRSQHLHRENEASWRTQQTSVHSIASVCRTQREKGFQQLPQNV